MSDCKHGNQWCNGTVRFSTTGPCLQCLRVLFKDRDEARAENAKLRAEVGRDANDLFRTREELTATQKENAKLREELAGRASDMERLMAEMAEITDDDLERVRDEWREVRRRRDAAREKQEATG